MTPATMDACARYLRSINLDGLRVLEVGARDINGSVRPLIEPHASEYIGIDIVDGPGVDRIMSVRDVVGEYGHQAFDLIVSTETLEHIEHWQGAVWGIKAATKVGGHVLLTTRMPGFPLHDQWGADYWRFVPENIMDAFGDFSPQMDWDYDDKGVYGLFKRLKDYRPWMPVGAAERVPSY